MARRHKNPDWLKPLLIGVGGFVAGVIVTSIARGSKGLTAGDGDVYYYWAEPETNSSFGSGWTPKIQRGSTGEVFSLSNEITEGTALWSAQMEIKKRGGIPQSGKPAG